MKRRGEAPDNLRQGTKLFARMSERFDRLRTYADPSDDLTHDQAGTPGAPARGGTGLIRQFDDADVYDDAPVRGVHWDGYEDDFDNEPHEDDLLLGRYIPEGEAGSGGFSSVIVAWDTRIQRRVAIKCMPLENATGALSTQGGSILVGRFDASSVTGLEEARTAAMLSDASIVSVYDFEVQGGMAYLILEYVDGMTLADVLRDRPDEIDADVAAAVFKAVAHALEVAHKHQVLHLDIKPENVLIDRQGQVKVTDFGLARLVGEGGYGIAVGGTIGYMPPEQMTGRELDEHCDQWALASLMYEVISGENPFMANSLAEAEDAIYDAELVIPSLCMEGLDEDIDDIMFCALDPDPTERYDSIKDFADQLQPCLGSPRRGKNALGRIVGQADDFEAEDAEEEWGPEEFEPHEPWHMTPRMREVAMRAWSVAGAGLLAFLALNTAFAPAAWSEPIAWGILLGCVVLAAIVPSVGALVCAEGLGVVLCAFGAPVPGVVLMIATGLWWFFAARYSVEATNVGLLGATCGAIGLAPLTPFVAGYLLPARDALVSTIYSACVALVLAGFGSASLLGWDIATRGMGIVGEGFTNVLLGMVSHPSLWIMILGWVLAAVVASLLCGMGKKFLCVLGMLLAGACLIVALVAGSLLDTAGADLLQDPFALAPIIGSFVVGAVIAGTAVPSRSLDYYSE